LRARDKGLLGILLTIWALCFALSLKSVWQGTGIPSLYVSSAEDPADYPTLVGFVPLFEAHESGLRIGDLLLRVGDADLRAVGPIGFFARMIEEAGADPHIRVVFEREGQRQETYVKLGSRVLFWPWVPISFLFALTAVFLLLRARPTPMARASFEASMCAAIGFGAFFGGTRTETYTSVVIHLFSFTLIYPLALRALLLFPHNKQPRSRWTRVAPWFFSLLGVFIASGFHGVPMSPGIGILGGGALVVMFYATALGIVTSTFRRSDAVERRQLKWCVFGIYCALVPPMMAAALLLFDPRLSPLYYISLTSIAIIPVALAISVARYNLFDIDRLMSATVSYNILLILAIAGGLVVVPRAAQAASEMVGLDPSMGQVILSLLLAVGVVAAQRPLRPRVERVFFAERYLLDQGIKQLLLEICTCGNPRELIHRTGEGLHRVLRPSACVVYGRDESGYTPVFVEGRAVPPVFDSGSPLIATLRERGGPLAMGDGWSRKQALELGPFDRAALETLDAAVVIPVRRAEEFLGFVCLGPKRSGDVYTSADLALLAAVSSSVSAQLLRFDQTELAKHARAMQDSLRRYVPRAVVDQLTIGQDLHAGDRQVSVLFVDLRGYVAYSEGRQPEDIFSTVSRYTETVSEIISKHAGSVVEFNGDGMMAVFGAPTELATKERAAVDAGRQIFTAVGTLPRQTSEGKAPALSVGVGIATGPAFVGNIKAADRMIWTAIGNTVNLAARLQSLTRELDAALVIDSVTWQALGGAEPGFEHHVDVSIRGRRNPENVYALPAGVTVVTARRAPLEPSGGIYRSH